MKKLLILPVALLLAFCHGGGQPAASTPTGPVVPTVAPTPAPVAAQPLSVSCAKLPDGDPKANCHDDSPTFLADVDDAIDTLRREQSYLFNDNEVLNVGAYYIGIIRILDRKGLCAGFDGEELGVKTSNDYNDQFKILTSRSIVRSGKSAFLGTCYPAAFPAPQGPLPPAPSGCSLPSSRSIACGRPPEGAYYDDVMAAIDQLLKQKPQLFDFTDHAPGTDSPRITDLPGYYAGVIAFLVSKGYCAIFDGEEIQLKRTNEFTEHYKIDYSNAYVRTGPGTLRGSCYPAAF